jgi:hypothetical protein
LWQTLLLLLGVLCCSPVWCAGWPDLLLLLLAALCCIACSSCGELWSLSLKLLLLVLLLLLLASKQPMLLHLLLLLPSGLQLHWLLWLLLGAIRCC